MAEAIDVHYQVGSGQTAYFGKQFVPEWVPALGTVADIGLNTIDSVRAGSNATGIFLAWSGAAWAPWLGAYGSFLFSGGGHSDGRDNDVYRYDVETRLTSKIKTKADSFQPAARGGYIADTTTGWMYASADDLTLQVGQPFTAHFYAHLLAIPPSARSGSADGWLFTPGRVAMPTPGQEGTNQAHRLAIGSETWDLHGSPLGNIARYGPCIYDSLRNRAVAIPDNNVQFLPWTDMDDETTGMLATDYTQGYYAIGGYHASSDSYMFTRYTGTTHTFKLINPTTGVHYTPGTTGTPPSETDEGAWDWCEEWNAWAYYPGLGGNNVYFLKAPASPRTQPWVWSMQTVTGTARSRQTGSGGPPYNRLRVQPELSLLVWAPKYNEPVQGFRVSAP